MSDDNLPPGCSSKDIDDHFGDPKMKECPTCDGAQEVHASDVRELRGWEWFKNLFLPVWIVCPRCEGQGEIVNEDEYDAEFYNECDRSLE